MGEHNTFLLGKRIGSLNAKIWLNRPQDHFQGRKRQGKNALKVDRKKKWGEGEVKANRRPQGVTLGKPKLATGAPEKRKIAGMEKMVKKKKLKYPSKKKKKRQGKLFALEKVKIRDRPLNPALGNKNTLRPEGEV